MTQTPEPGGFILKWRGDTLAVTLDLGRPAKGRAAFRTNLGHARVRRREIIAETERGETPMARAWTDIPMREDGPGLFRAEIPLDEVGVFSGKACFFPEGSSLPEWPDGRNLHVKVESADTRSRNSIYTVFPRQFGSFREIVRRLDHIMDVMGFRIVQTLPPFPVPTTYAVMGEYGCPFAALDFFSVDPAMAEFDEFATPLDQFTELIDAVHGRGGLFFVDLPANHTGWASVLQTHHPEWFRREKDGRFASPGAWGVKWADLVELDYSSAGLRSYMADVFLFWCRRGVDGFRCDAGYMIPAKTWEYIVARVREEYPDTVFMLEGLGGELSVTDALLAESNLDWAYSEVFQTYDRGAFEWYLPGAIARAEKYGTLVHFAETHDNDRLAKKGETYARLRVQLSALLSWQGAWGISNGVEWYCTEKIDVHGRNDLNWNAKRNMVPLVAKLNSILATEPTFSGPCRLEVVTRGDGNTIAVVREGEGGRRALFLANLDCGAPVRIEWDRSRFPADEAFDLLSGRKTASPGAVGLEPGEVKFLVEAAKEAKAAGNAAPAARRPLFRWEFPRDLARDFAVPAGETAEVSAMYPFRIDIVDPADGRTLQSCKSSESRGLNTALFASPRYEGDGTRCRSLALKIVAYTPGGATRAQSRFMVPPPPAAAAAKTALAGDEIRRNPAWRTVLSNGAGAASQMRIGWGAVASQYDAILAANPNPTCPSDRLVVWTRLRCWLQREGYVREFDSRCTERFEADPSGQAARWTFRVPCGMGKTTEFRFDVALARGKNAARVKVARVPAGADDVGESVRIVFRPDVEWRSFHSSTKAYAGPETSFPGAVAPSDGGFVFSPGKGSLLVNVAGGAYHHEPQWTYCAPHPEEAERGQDPAGDLFSPGWISADLKVGDTVEIVGVVAGLYGNGAAETEGLGFPEFRALPAAMPLGDALKRSLDLFIVRRDDLKTVIAGYPWFLDWGRDTFIFMRGMIAAGKLEESAAILRAFAAFEEKGTLPNIIYGRTAGNRDTTDAQLWFIECVFEAEAAGADVAGLRKVCESIVDNYIAGTPNGIRVDADSGLVWSPPHFTWMDTNYPACTPRTGYPVEIQALWIAALRNLGRKALAEKALESVKKYFRVPQGAAADTRPGAPRKGYYDCLAAPHGESAAKAVPEPTLRPNQLMLITLGILDDRSIIEATAELLAPGTMRSLGASSPFYCGRYEGDEDTRRKPAYHNGTAWGWQFPMWAEALAASGPRSRATAMAVLASAVENLNGGCLCHMSEISDGDAPHAQKGCAAQAWSVSELLRVWCACGKAEAHS